MELSSLRQGGIQICAVLSTSVLLMTASLVPLSRAHAADNAQSPTANAKPSTSAKTTKPVAAPKPDIDFRGVLLGVPGQVNALKDLCLSDANAKLAEAAKHVEDPTIDLGKLTYSQMSEAQKKLSSAQYDVKYCEREIKANVNGGRWQEFRLQYANLNTIFHTLKTSDDGAVLQLFGNVVDDSRAPLLILLRERFGVPQVKSITYQNRAGARYDYDTFTWMDGKSNTIEVTPSADLTHYLLVFKAGIVAEKRVEVILDSVSKGRSKM